MCLTSPHEIRHLWFRTRTHKKDKRADGFAFTLFLELDVWRYVSQWPQHGLAHRDYCRPDRWTGSGAHDGKTDAFFNWRFAPVEIRTDTDSGNRTPACTNSKENVQYKKLGILNSNQLSGIENLDSSSTNLTVFSTGNAPKNLHVHNCYMTEALEPESESINRKKGDK